MLEFMSVSVSVCDCSLFAVNLISIAFLSVYVDTEMWRRVLSYSNTSLIRHYDIIEGFFVLVM